MKLVFLAPFGIRPKGTVIARMLPLAAKLQELGHEVVIVAPPYTNPEDSGKVEVVDGVRLRNVVLGPQSKVLSAPVLAWRLFRAALDERPDLIHLFKPKGYGGLAQMLLVLRARVGVRGPCLFLDTDDWEGEGGMNELHGYSAAERTLYAFQEKWLPVRMSGVTVASRVLRDFVSTMGVPDERLLYLPNCVDGVRRGDGQKVRARHGLPADAPVLLLYTRFFEFEQEELHRFFAEVHRRVPCVRFLVVGKGNNGEEEQLAVAAKNLGFDSALAVAGWVQPAELPDYLAAGDVAIYPFADTLVNRSKCPAKLTELLRAGVAVVASNVGQIPEYLAPELHGGLCPAGDWDGMIERSVRLLLSPEARMEFAAVEKGYLVERFNWARYALSLNDFYLHCIGA